MATHVFYTDVDIQGNLDVSKGDIVVGSDGSGNRLIDLHSNTSGSYARIECSGTTSKLTAVSQALEIKAENVSNGVKIIGPSGNLSAQIIDAQVKFGEAGVEDFIVDILSSHASGGLSIQTTSNTEQYIGTLAGKLKLVSVDGDVELHSNNTKRFSILGTTGEVTVHDQQFTVTEDTTGNVVVEASNARTFGGGSSIVSSKVAGSLGDWAMFRLSNGTNSETTLIAIDPATGNGGLYSGSATPDTSKRLFSWGPTSQVLNFDEAPTFDDKTNTAINIHALRASALIDDPLDYVESGRWELNTNGSASFSVANGSASYAFWATDAKTFGVRRFQINAGSSSSDYAILQHNQNNKFYVLGQTRWMWRAAWESDSDVLVRIGLARSYTNASSDPSDGVWAEINSDNTYIKIKTSGSGDVDTSVEISGSEDTWHWIELRLDGINARLYIDGTLEATVAWAPSGNSRFSNPFMSSTYNGATGVDVFLDHFLLIPPSGGIDADMYSD